MGKGGDMKSLTLILCLFLGGCGLNNVCAAKGAQWGYLVGALATKSDLKA